jgi:hypothetical protein
MIWQARRDVGPAWAARSSEILGRDQHMASGAGHHALARPFQRLLRPPGRVEQALAIDRFNFLGKASVGAEETDQGHA